MISPGGVSAFSELFWWGHWFCRTYRFLGRIWLGNLWGDVQDLTRDLDGENCFLTTEDVLPAVDVNYDTLVDPNATNTDSIAIEQAGNYPVPNNSVVITQVSKDVLTRTQIIPPTATIDDGLASTILSQKM